MPNKPYGYIYLITHLESGRYYVGQTTMTIEKRWISHVVKAKKHAECVIHRAIAKYGPDSFVMEVLATVADQIALDEQERLWILLLQARDRLFGYNIRSGGLGGRHSEETKEKLRIARAHQVPDPEANKRAAEKRRGLIPWNKGRTCPEISEARKGKGTGARGPIKHSEASIETRFKPGLTPWNSGKKCPQLSKPRGPMPEGSVRRGPDHPCFGKASWNKGIPRTLEERAKMSASQKRRQAREKAEREARGL